MADYDSVDFFSDESLLEDPYPYFEHLRSKCPVLPHREPRGGRRLGLRGGVRGLPRQPHVLLVQLGHRTLRHLPGAARGRRRRRDHRPPPRPAADERAHGDHGPAGAHPRASPRHAPAHAQASEGERGVHVAARRPPDRRVRRRRPLRVHRRVLAAVRHADGGRRARRARIRSPAVPRGFRAERLTWCDR